MFYEKGIPAFLTVAILLKISLDTDQSSETRATPFDKSKDDTVSVWQQKRAF